MENINLRFLQRIHNEPYKTYRPNDNRYCHIAILKDWSDYIQKGVHPQHMDQKNDHEFSKYCLDEADRELSDRLFEPEDFFSVANYLMCNEECDCYFSINSFWKRKKKTEDIRHLNAFVLDYDFYKHQRFSSLTPEEMYQKHIKHTLPKKATAAINSGRGLYVVYIFRHCSYKRLKLYKRIYKELYSRQRNFGMDPKAMNPTQVIRLPGTFNSKSLSTVKIIELNDTDYKLEDFADLLPYKYEQVVAFKEQKQAQKWKSNQQKNIASDSGKIRRMRDVKMLLDDFKTLISLRNRAGIYKGYREYLIFLALEKMLWSGFKQEEAFEIAAELNQCFHVPLSEHEVINRCKPAKIFYYSTFKNKMIRNLEITEEEQAQLNYLKSTTYLNKLKQRRQNRHPLLNRTYKEIELMNRRNKVLKLKLQGKTNKYIADHLIISKVIVNQDLHYIKDHLHEFKAILKSMITEIVSILNTKELSNKLTFEEHKKFLEWLEISDIAFETT